MLIDDRRDRRQGKGKVKAAHVKTELLRDGRLVRTVGGFCSGVLWTGFAREAVQIYARFISHVREEISFLA